MPMRVTRPTRPGKSGTVTSASRGASCPVRLRGLPRRVGATLLATAWLCLAPSASRADANPVLVFAAASLSGALTEVAETFDALTGSDIVLSFAGSSSLARQILLGAPADLFLSADAHWADAVETAGRAEPDGRVALLANRLVLIAHGGDTEAGGAATVEPDTLTPAFDLEAALGDGRLAIGLVEAVPAGRYGAAALRAMGFWDLAADRLAQTDNVRAALALVATGAAPVGIVYATDAAAEPRVLVLGAFPEDSHPPIVYPLLDLTGRDGPEENAFFAYLTGPAAREIFLRHGFTVLGDAP